MNKKTLALIVGLFVITCGLLYLALRTPPYQKPAASPTPTPLSVNAHTMLSLAPTSASESSSLTKYTLAVGMDTNGDLVNSVQLELAYDPQALTGVVVTPGKFFQQPSALVNSVNTTDGRISYALVEQMDLPSKKGTGTVAYISFNVSPTFTGKTTPITFLPKTAVAADKILESVLRKATGYTLTIVKPSITQPVGTNSSTQSAQ
ncbi:MAG TPA: cohesin domain-containing protein [Candidatus Eisenbacteria bacterium]|nr:cohesin domain-containing protein [Candidatus Eisenbacteria bacterium]